MRGAYPYENLPREEFEKILEMLPKARGRGRAAPAYSTAIRCMAFARPARRAALRDHERRGDSGRQRTTMLFRRGRAFVGKVNETSRSRVWGRYFSSGKQFVRIRRVSSASLGEDAHGLRRPFRLGRRGAGASAELSEALSSLRQESMYARPTDRRCSVVGGRERRASPGGGSDDPYSPRRRRCWACVLARLRRAERFSTRGRMQLVITLRSAGASIARGGSRCANAFA